MTDGHYIADVAENNAGKLQSKFFDIGIGVESVHIFNNCIGYDD